MLRFNQTWLEIPQFSEWLVAVTNDESKAYCRCCEVVLRAHKNDLMTHVAKQKHIKSAAAGVKGPAGPISVQIIPSDGDEGDELDEEFGDLNARSPRVKRYRKEWEEVDELKNWISQCANDVTRAYCRVCDIPLRAHRHDLMIHAKSSKHKRKEETVGFNPILSKDDEAVATITGDVDDGNGLDNDVDWEPEEPAMKKNKGSRSYSANRASAGSKHGTLNVSDVIRAIQRNEFSGYELLQIVKAAVPKL